jgi:L-alanine-DL-glutamate epimerase-like enolase superfamily enzyme
MDLADAAGADDGDIEHEGVSRFLLSLRPGPAGVTGGARRRTLQKSNGRPNRRVPLTIASIRARVHRCPIATPVVTSFGVMRDRPMLLVRAEDAAGAVGWGEIWCNFPSVGAEHRARLVDRVLAPMIEGGRFADPAACFAQLSARTAILALQSGEPGPIAQAIAGIDIALWDLTARRAETPLWRMLGGSDPSVTPYASGLNPTAPERLAAIKRDEGFRAFKLKLGFGADRDQANLLALRAELGEAATLMADVNQGWTEEQASREAPALRPHNLRWLEEPLRADIPWPVWRRLAGHAALPLAAGENVAGEAGFAAAIASGALAVVQPDIGKWGGFSGCLPVARAVVAAGLTYCPHWLGGSIGLLASAHLLAAVDPGGRSGGMLEVDANPNPLRSLTAGPLATIKEGRATLTEQPGLGAPPDETGLRCYIVPH